MYLVTHYPVNSLNDIIQKLSLRNFPTNVIQCLVIGTDRDMTGQQRRIHFVSACSYHKLLSYRVHGTMYIVHGSSQIGVATEWVGQQEESLVPNWTRFWICVDEIGNYFQKDFVKKMQMAKEWMKMVEKSMKTVPEKWEERGVRFLISFQIDRVAEQRSAANFRKLLQEAFQCSMCASTTDPLHKLWEK